MSENNPSHHAHMRAVISEHERTKRNVIAPTDFDQKLSDFLDALDEWGCEDNAERAQQIIDFQRTGYDLDAYHIEHPEHSKSEVN